MSHVSPDATSNPLLPPCHAYRRLCPLAVALRFVQSVESPPLPTRRDPGSNTPLAKRHSSFFPNDRDDASEGGNHLVGGDDNEESPRRGLRGGDASCNSSPPPPPRPRSSPPVNPTGMPAGFSATNIRRSRPGTFEDPTPSPTGTAAGSAHGKVRKTVWVVAFIHPC